MSFTSYNVDNDKRFSKALQKASKEIGDLRIPLTLISKDFYKSQKAIFMLQGPGQYPDFKGEETGSGLTRYQNFKLIKYGFDYPLLKATGALEDSVTKPSDKNAINQITNKRSLVIGTKIKYGIYHQSDKPRSVIPQRKFLFIGPESNFANNDQKGRPERWAGYLNAFVLKKMELIA